MRIRTIRQAGRGGVEVVGVLDGVEYTLFLGRNEGGVSWVLRSEFAELAHGPVNAESDDGKLFQCRLCRVPPDLCIMLDSLNSAFNGYLSALAARLPLDQQEHGMIWMDDVSYVEAFFIEGFRYFVRDCEVWWSGWSAGNATPKNLGLALDNYIRKNFPASMHEVYGYDCESDESCVRSLQPYHARIHWDGDGDPIMWAHVTLDEIVEDGIRLKYAKKDRTPRIHATVRPDLVGELIDTLESDHGVASYTLRSIDGGESNG